MSKAFIMLENATLRFFLYGNKSPALKEAVIGRLTQSKTLKGCVEFEALKNINLKIGSGERVGILGLNGAGKTSLLKLVAGIYTPHAGKVTIRGQCCPLIELGTGFDLELTGRENIYLNGSLLGRSPKEMSFLESEIVDFCEIGEFIDVPMKYYSSGMYSRLAFSIATLLDPQILILDEILATGDAKFVKKAGERINKIIANSEIVLMSGHDVDMIKEICTRAILIHDGRVACDGHPDEVAEFYLNEIAGAVDSEAKFLCS